MSARAEGSQRHLDVGCGTGRYSIEFAKRGYSVIDIDLSAGMLAEAERSAQKVGVKVIWIKTDAAKSRLKEKFGAAICICEGAFALLGEADSYIKHDLAILRNINATLKQGSGLVLTAPSGFHKIRKYVQNDVEEGRFDPLTLTETFLAEWETLAGHRSVLVRERGYVPTELTQLFSQAGFRVEHTWGGTAENWGRQGIELDEIEIMVIGKKHNHKPF